MQFDDLAAEQIDRASRKSGGVNRQDAMTETKKQFTAKEISEDVHKANEKNIDELTKIQSANVDNLVKAKVNEVMKV